MHYKRALPLKEKKKKGGGGQRKGRERTNFEGDESQTSELGSQAHFIWGYNFGK